MFNSAVKPMQYTFSKLTMFPGQDLFIYSVCCEMPSLLSSFARALTNLTKAGYLICCEWATVPSYKNITNFSFLLLFDDEVIFHCIISSLQVLGRLLSVTGILTQCRREFKSLLRI